MDGIKDLILSLKTPAVFHGNICEWDFVKWSEEEWCNLFGEKPVPFRCGPKKCSRSPQWERTCKTENMTMRNFFQSAKNINADSWQYFDYKYLNEWLKDSDAFEALSWAKLGFPELKRDESTLWIGSPGAHTPCHMDSYGCNLVAQVHGHKQWILFPQSESAKLEMTRLPYEESSVYSALNFYAPIKNLNDSLDQVYIVTLSPGDVLVVPHHWWHYVENLDTAIAINTWIPVTGDDDCRLDEALVRFFVAQATAELSPAQWFKLINPNEDSLKTEQLSTSLNLIKVCLRKVQEALTVSQISNQNSDVMSVKNEDFVDLSETNEHKYEVSNKRRKLSLDNLVLSSSSASGGMSEKVDFKMLEKSGLCDLKNILNAKCKCDSEEEHIKVMDTVQDTDSVMEVLPAVINAFCHPDVLKTVKSILQQQTCVRL